MRKTYSYYKDRGICVSCHRQKAIVGRVRCSECLKMQKTAQDKYRGDIYAEGGSVLEEYRRMKRFSTRKWRMSKEAV